MATLQIPGYHFDGKKYFKVIPGRPAPPPLPKEPQTPVEPSSGRKRKKLRPEQEKGKWRAVDQDRGTSMLWMIRQEREGVFGTGERERLRHGRDAAGLSRLRPLSTLYPDCLPVDESIIRIATDDRDPSILRVGGSSGTIATGSLNRADADSYPNDEQGWRTSWLFPSQITSLHTCGDRILVTCLGAPAQALIGTTSDNISLASVTLSPRKTSLWTAALSPTVVALGCDRKVMISRDPSQPSMDGYVTGGRHGDGSVFAIDLTENLIFAGTRKGQVKIFDQRSSPTSDEVVSRPEIDLTVSSSVTNVRRLEQGVLVASMDGSLGLYDLRFPTPTPLLTLQGHVNAYTWDLGFDTWRDEFVAAAGQDKRIRLWSLRTGRLLPAPPLPQTATTTALPLLTRTFSDPIKALRFAEPPPFRRDDGGSVSRLPRDAEAWEERGGMGSRAGREPGLWIGDGDGLAYYGI